MRIVNYALWRLLVTPSPEEKGNPVMHELLRKKLPDRLKGFDLQKPAFVSNGTEGYKCLKS